MIFRQVFICTDLLVGLFGEEVYFGAPSEFVRSIDRVGFDKQD